jgi:hypothetical protein
MRIEQKTRDNQQLIVTDHPLGWHIREFRGQVVVRDVVRDDWHRVERDMRLFRFRAFGTVSGRPPARSAA